MAEFVRAQIFGTTFEITSRYARPLSRPLRPLRHADHIVFQILRPPARWHGSLWPRMVRTGARPTLRHASSQSSHCPPRRPASRPRASLTRRHSSARDQLTNQNVAVKKIMKPFSTPVLAKRTYRELKLLKHLRHENVPHLPTPPPRPRRVPLLDSRILTNQLDANLIAYRLFPSVTSSSPLSKTCTPPASLLHTPPPCPY